MRLLILFLGLLLTNGAAHAQQSAYVLQPGDTVEISVLQIPL